jgi:16S rRNA (guanine527-N7)-methyltransferase
MDEVSQLGLDLTPEQEGQFGLYLRLLLAWNERMNLTAVRDPHTIQQRHFYDSLTCVQATGDLNGRTLIDVGTGAGFPGLPLKIAFPGLRLVLVESVVKKTQFLQAVAAELGLSEVQILAERAEVLGQQPAHREQYDWAVGRGVAEMRVLAEYLLPLCRVGGHMLAQKGANALAETAVAHHALHTLGGGEPQFYPVQLPDKTALHYLVVIEKIAATPEKYPRRVGVAGKRPL